MTQTKNAQTPSHSTGASPTAKVARSLFDPIEVGNLKLKNRIVLAPLTRNRSPNAIPGPHAAEYYAQRASGGLLITEATAISQQGQGYADVPGLYGSEQLDGWKNVTRRVHEAGGKIVVQLWHVGRISHTSLQPDGGATSDYTLEAGSGSGAAAPAVVLVGMGVIV